MKITIQIDTDIDDLTAPAFDGLFAMLQAARPASEDEEQAGVDLDERELAVVVKDLHRAGLACDEGKPFRTPELFKLARTGESWNALSPNTRKALGRRLRKLAQAHYDEATWGDPVIVFKGKTIQNSAIYEKEEKEED